MWIVVLYRYIAVRKPVRYFTVQTRTRCQCWMAFTWISSAMLCCPPLLEFSDPTYEKDIAVCMLDWHGMAAYSVTLSILILGPSLITILYTYVYIYGAIRRLRRGFLAHDKVNFTLHGHFAGYVGSPPQQHIVSIPIYFSQVILRSLHSRVLSLHVLSCGLRNNNLKNIL